jgi:hypothetical protein
MIEVLIILEFILGIDSDNDDNDDDRRFDFIIKD